MGIYQQKLWLRVVLVTCQSINRYKPEILGQLHESGYLG